MLKRIIVAGGTGFVGKPLVKELCSNNYQVVVLSRAKPKATPSNSPVLYEQWDAKTIGPWAKTISTAHAVINLTGEGIANKRWTRQQKERIRSSRLESTQILIDAFKQAESKPGVFINASAVGYYGSVPTGKVTEEHPRGEGFLADVCSEWEQCARQAEQLGIRTVFIRTGIVLEQGGGALSKILPPFKFFLGGPLGSGRQPFPWIHRADLLRMILFAIECTSLQGPVNGTAPNPVDMKTFCHTLGQVMKRPSWAPVPAFMLKILLGEMSEMLLTGQYAIPQKALTHHFSFNFPTLKEALCDILDPVKN